MYVTYSNSKNMTNRLNYWNPIYYHDFHVVLCRSILDFSLRIYFFVHGHARDRTKLKSNTCTGAQSLKQYFRLLTILINNH